MPDFRDEEARRRYEDDHWTPDPVRARSLPPDMIAPSALGGPTIKSAEARQLAKQVWGEQGYAESDESLAEFYEEVEELAEATADRSR